MTDLSSWVMLVAFSLPSQPPHCHYSVWKTPRDCSLYISDARSLTHHRCCFQGRMNQLCSLKYDWQYWGIKPSSMRTKFSGNKERADGAYYTLDAWLSIWFLGKFVCGVWCCHGAADLHIASCSFSIWSWLGYGLG